jgi:ATP-dependent DNA ligase
VIGKVLEVKANELFKDTGKMRHPRFLRMRPDKNPEDCTWKDHIGED